MIDFHLQTDVEDAEGLKLEAYKDSVGLWTIGYGHRLDQTKDWTGFGISQDRANLFLQQDLQQWQDFAQTLPEWKALDTPCRQNAVTELCYNMGKKWLLFVNCRGAIERADWQEAHDQLLSSLWASQVHANRATRLAKYLLSGTY